MLVGVIALIADMLFRVSALRRRPPPRGRQSADRRSIIGIAALVLAPISARRCCRCRCRAGASTWPTPRPPRSPATPRGWRARSPSCGDDKRPLKYVTRATAHLYIESPLRDHQGLRSSLGGLFDTHPPLEERIHRLEDVGGFDIPDPEPLEQ